MKIVFAGTPEFASVALQMLYDAGHEIPLVLTQPDRPGGRGMRLQLSPVKQLALRQGSKVLQPQGLRLDGRYGQEAQQVQQALADVAPEVMVVAAYGLILPQWVLDMPAKGCLNIHASLLPRWRGAAPIHRAIEAGDAQTGITIMQMDAGLDTGPMLRQCAVPIEEADTTGVLHDKLARLGGQMIVEQLALPVWPAAPQPCEGVTYAQKIEKSEAIIDWAQDAQTIARRIRAFNPYPGAQALLCTAAHPAGELLKIWEARCQNPEPESQGKKYSDDGPGAIISADGNGITVACGQGNLCITQLQRAGGKKLDAADFLRGKPLQKSDFFG